MPDRLQSGLIKIWWRRVSTWQYWNAPLLNATLYALLLALGLCSRITSQTFSSMAVLRTSQLDRVLTLMRYLRVTRYAIACLLAMVATGIVGVVDLTFSFAPFLTFAICTALSWLFCGIGPCVLSLCLCATASDFLFLSPRFELSLDHRTAGLTSVYLVCALCSRTTVYGMQRFIAARRSMR